jgi:hypothetical protein
MRSALRYRENLTVIDVHAATAHRRYNFLSVYVSRRLGSSKVRSSFLP